ncbi:MAG TPA: hypothetical protein VGE62_02155 [Candidatus Paceibacterota bacterium]
MSKFKESLGIGFEIQTLEKKGFDWEGVLAMAAFAIAIVCFAGYVYAETQIMPVVNSLL